MGQTQQDQIDYYKLVYSIVETSIDTADVVKGIAFWRWSAATAPTGGLGAFDNYATISEPHRPSSLATKSCIAWHGYLKLTMEKAPCSRTTLSL